MYIGDFDHWEDVANAFDTSTPAPEEVIFAGYTYESYSGDAFVIYRNGNKYFTVDGGHCSCYGLEGQWEPEEYDLPLLITSLDKRWDYGAFSGNDKKTVLANLRKRV